MIICKFTEDNTICSTEDYAENPEKFRGFIVCAECSRKAWFIKSYKTSKIDRKACFASNHVEGCSASTVLLSSDDEIVHGAEKNDEQNNSDISIDLDKNSSASLFISEPNNKFSNEETNWANKKRVDQFSNGVGFPLNKSLRQLLTYLCRNPNYADDKKTIVVKADNGRVIVDGTLKSLLVPLNKITKSHQGENYIFWGKINNLNIDSDNILWLNYGDYRTEPSILLEPSTYKQILEKFKITAVEELDGSDIIAIGRAGISKNNKAIIRVSFPKYIAFRRLKVIDTEKSALEDN